MRAYVCFKCGSTDVDDGRRPLLSLFGLCLIVLAPCIALYLLSRQPADNWQNPAPMTTEQALCACLMSTGIFLVFEGMERADRVRCLKCGKVWTPPQWNTQRAMKRPATRRAAATNSVVVYFSKFGNTRLVAAALAEELKARGTVRLLSAAEFTPADLTGIDLLVIGSPTHRMNVPGEVRSLLAKLPQQTLHHLSIAAFDTSYKMPSVLIPFTAARKLARSLRKLGGTQAVSPETFFVAGLEGPLYDGEIARAKVWANQIMAQARA